MIILQNNIQTENLYFAMAEYTDTFHLISTYEKRVKGNHVILTIWQYNKTIQVE